MKRQVLLAIAMSFLTVWLLQYFTHKNDAPVPTGAPGGIKSGQFYSSPTQQTWHHEPQKEIDFIDTQVTPVQEKRIVVQTPLCELTFSNFGGIIQSISFKNHKGKDGKVLKTIANDTLTERENGCFLLALPAKTPYLYQEIAHQETADGHKIVYQVEADGWLIRKTFFVNNRTYKIDLSLDFEPLNKEAKPLLPRLFFPSPAVLEVPDNSVDGVMTHDGTSVEKVSKAVELSGVWGLPEIFGSEDKYFVHTLYKDGHHFAQGGYYKRVNNKLFSILEGSELKEKKRFDVSFYMGPKLLNDLSVVDQRLEDLLSFGWLSWLCKLLLKLLEFIYKHIGNFGFAIILLTILLKLPFLPLTISSRRKMDEYQKFQPTIARIRAKYRGDMQKQQEEIMRFHQEHNLSAATPIIGCLPLLIQLPILFALYRVLGNYLSLYQAPFFGWIHDLSIKDPYYVLPILMGATMLLQQQMTPVTDEKQRLMMMFMPVLMTAVFINFPAGLVLYWLMNNVLTILEDFLRKRIWR